MVVIWKVGIRGSQEAVQNWFDKNAAQNRYLKLACPPSVAFAMKAAYWDSLGLVHCFNHGIWVKP